MQECRPLNSESFELTYESMIERLGIELVPVVQAMNPASHPASCLIGAASSRLVSEAERDASLVRAAWPQ